MYWADGLDSHDVSAFIVALVATDEVLQGTHCAACPYPPRTAMTTVLRNIQYIDHTVQHESGCQIEPSPRHVLDIYLPANSKEDKSDVPASHTNGIPVVVHVHGGGWQRGSKDNEWRGAPKVKLTLNVDTLFSVICLSGGKAPE